MPTRCRTGAGSTVTLWPETRNDYPDDVKTPFNCRTCGGQGFVYFDRASLEDLPLPLAFECTDCSLKVAQSLRARGLCPSCGLKPCAQDCELGVRTTIVEHLTALIELVGLDKSESATEAFVELLDQAVINAQEEIRKSHDEGLSLDCRWIIAETLMQGIAAMKD